MSYNPYSYGDNTGNINDRFVHNEHMQGVTSPFQQPNIQSQVPPQQAQQAYMNQQQSQQQGPQMNPVMGAFQDPGASMAYQLGQTAFSNFIGRDNFSQFQDTMSKAAGNAASLSHYFQVTTSYVMQKVRLILFPFISKNNWQRIPDSQVNSAGTLTFLPPRDDVNSPDMYIPIMGLVTYILVWNTQRGLQGSFNPENLYYKLSSTLAFVCLDLIILKLGLYLLVNTNSPTTILTELICYVGYKFVPLTLVLFLPKSPFYLTIILKVYLFIAFGVFLLRSVKFNLFNTPGDDLASVKKSTVKKCNYFLFVYGFFWQSVLMWLIS
ncbi:hypothetical protein TBLA_0A05570 [Henningerozyma blattae CBS 6284]|uniref:Protein YIF1 n=1 Tax=Henningerozyma blattae (strain ATCC 34711 / CBS 6284 / DSM 70876 / NBRC 10599 / NRRL Y-10934 / UCD 77-7) TaxID=1071380 RepID=I2GW48_HENB6|nr:hypothetical protein TBLA_0A05570 [Tetrapisispora blattae CBS 6284]CCH58350.1 hypothetical protein TBLA_0A05570 [Tetrapisispora blattae CBS 6284]